MNKQLIFEVKKKKQFSELPDSLVERALDKVEGNVKEARALLRKFFGVFLTNKVLKLKDESILGSHISSKGRDYGEFYEKLGVGDFESVVDLGCGVNGFSYRFMGVKNYVGIEAVGQIVKSTNDYLRDRGFEGAHVLHEDLFDVDKIVGLIRQVSSPKIVMMLQVVDALENFERDYSKRLILEIGKVLSVEDKIVITMPVKSISGKKTFEAQRGWLKDFLEENFNLENEFVLGTERVFIVGKML
jgi:hypothetical protein